MPYSGCWPTAWSPAATSSSPDARAAAGAGLAYTAPLGPDRLVSALGALSARAPALSPDLAGDGGRRADLFPHVSRRLYPGLAKHNRAAAGGFGDRLPGAGDCRLRPLSRRLRECRLQPAL